MLGFVDARLRIDVIGRAPRTQAHMVVSSIDNPQRLSTYDELMGFVFVLLDKTVPRQVR